MIVPGRPACTHTFDQFASQDPVIGLSRETPNLHGSNRVRSGPAWPKSI